MRGAVGATHFDFLLATIHFPLTLRPQSHTPPFLLES